MSNIVTFSYVFNEDIERIYECFSNFCLVTEMSFNHLITNIKKIKGNNFDELGAVFSFTWKNYYNIEITVENLISTETHKSFVHLANKIEEIPGFGFSINYNFYWNSCEKKTIFTYDYTYRDPFFDQLIKDEVTEKEKLTICQNVENYLRMTTKGLDQLEAAVIKGPFLEVWDIISDWSKLLVECKDVIKVSATYNGDCRLLGTQVELFESEKKVVIGSLVIKNVLMSEDKMELIFETVKKDKNILPKQSVYIRLVKMDEDACFLSVNHVANEYISSDVLGIISKFKKKVLKYIRDYFENKKKGIKVKNKKKI